MYFRIVSRKTIISIVALLFIALVGGAGAIWAYKKYKNKQNQEFRFQGTLGTANANFDEVAFKAVILDDSAMEAVVKKHQLVSVWGVSGVDAAKTILQQKFSVKVSEGSVNVTYQDKDKVLAKAVLETIVNNYFDNGRSEGLHRPPSG